MCQFLVRYTTSSDFFPRKLITRLNFSLIDQLLLQQHQETFQHSYYAIFNQVCVFAIVFKDWRRDDLGSLHQM